MRFSRVLLVMLLSGVACSPPAGVETRPPNIVFIVGDDLGWADLGSYGSGFYETPNIDSLRAEVGAIRVGDFKLIEFFETGEIELYNLAAVRPEKATELQDQLNSWRKAVAAPMPQTKP